jgi:Protein of unknown function (DUF3386)
MFHKAVCGFAVAFLLALAGVPARAHFIWLDAVPAAGGDWQARLYFSEEPAPGEPHLVNRAANTKVWTRGVSGNTSDLKFSAEPTDELAALVAPCPMGAASIEGACDYGVYERGPGVLLQYYAKRLAGDWQKHPELARAERLKLDIVPSVDNGKLAVDVLYGGKPSAASEVVFIDPTGEHHELKTDAQGRALIAAGAGRWAVRAAHIEADRAGERDGKKFAQTWHYATLVLDLPAGKSVAGISAADALARARDGRAIWTDFPGFASDVTIRGGGQDVTGKLEIDADGNVSLDAPASPLRDWAEEQLNSLVQHRMPDGEITTGNVTYADDDADHPLGRKINLGDSNLSSAYRLKDDVIMEVNRSMGKMRFTISVLEIERNAEDKYLPRSFAMNFFVSATGELTNSLAYRNDWQRVGRFDLPGRILEIDAKKGGSTTKEIVFANCRLLEKK